MIDAKTTAHLPTMGTRYAMRGFGWYVCLCVCMFHVVAECVCVDMFVSNMHLEFIEKLLHSSWGGLYFPMYIRHVHFT